MFEPEVFRKQIYCIEKILVALLGLFGARGIVPPFAPRRYIPGSTVQSP